MRTGCWRLSPLIFCMLLLAGVIVSMPGIPAAQTGGLKNRQCEHAVNALDREMLTAHNNIRSELKLPPLLWSSKLAAFSQKWANTLLEKNRTAHNPDSPYGENIFIAGTGSTPSSAVRLWASESKDYDYRTNSCKGDCGHYTQIVWRQTEMVGCAVARSPQREIWVCSYDPPGNFRGEWPY